MRNILLFFSVLCLTLTVKAQDDLIDEVPVDEQDVFTIVENLPEFKGGPSAQNRFIAENFKIPKEVRDSGGVIRMYVLFTVDTMGCVQDISVRGNDLLPSLEKAGIDAVKKMKCHWTPGIQRGRKVKVRMSQPITVRVE